MEQTAHGNISGQRRERSSHVEQAGTESAWGDMCEKVEAFEAMVKKIDARAWKDEPYISYDDWQKVYDEYLAERAIFSLEECFNKLKEEPDQAKCREKLVELCEKICTLKLAPELGAGEDQSKVVERMFSQISRVGSVLGEIIKNLSMERLRGGERKKVRRLICEYEPVLGQKKPNSFLVSYVRYIFMEEGNTPNFNAYDKLLAQWVSLSMGDGKQDDEDSAEALSWFGKNLLMHTESTFSSEAKVDDERELMTYDRQGIESEFCLRATRVELFKQAFPAGRPLTHEQEATLFKWMEEEDEAVLYRREIAQVLRQGDQERARKRLEELRTDDGLPTFVRELALSVERRLDMGDTSVTESGVDYHGQTYDLGDHNREGVKVRRLTGEGDVAIFDEARRLDGVFTAVPGEGERLHPGIGQLTVDDVTLPDFAGHKKHKRQQRLETYLGSIYEFMTEDFFHKTGVYPADLSLLEQASLVEFLQGTSAADRKRALNFFYDFQIDGIRALISITGSVDVQTRMQELRQFVQQDDSDPERVFAEHGRLIEFVLEAHKHIAPLLREKLGDMFDERTWVQECALRADERLNKALSSNQEVGQEAELPTMAASYDSIIQKIAVDLANQFSAEEIKGILQDLPEQVARLLVPYLQPETPGETKEDLKRLYESIRFEGYELNKKMTPIELARLHTWLPKGKPVLDAGCGTGRLLIPLAKLGFDIRGFDYTPRHVRVVQEELAAAGLNPARVQEGDWLATSYPDASFEAVSCLGRNILHEYRLERQQRFFAEMHRILKPGGKLIVDVPDTTIRGSHYDQLTNGYREAMQKRGIKNTRPGTIFDSPDNQNFATRHVYSDLELRRFAREAGFEVVSVESEDLPTGQGDRNLYYTLRKTENVEAEEYAMAA